MKIYFYFPLPWLNSSEAEHWNSFFSENKNTCCHLFIDFTNFSSADGIWHIYYAICHLYYFLPIFWELSAIKKIFQVKTFLESTYESKNEMKGAIDCMQLTDEIYIP